MRFNNSYNFLRRSFPVRAERLTGQKLLNRFRPSRLIDQIMNTKIFSLLAAASLALSNAVFAAGPKDDYQVTGPIAEVNDSMIVIEKGKSKERFEIARDSSTKTTGELKVGDKATVYYGMKASSIEVKAAKAEKGTKKEKASPAASPKS
jgi:hypothetical protein